MPEPEPVVDIPEISILAKFKPIDAFNPYVLSVDCMLESFRNESALFRKFEDQMKQRFFKDNLQDYCRVYNRIWWSSQLRVLANTKSPKVKPTLARHDYKVETPNFRICSTCISPLQKGRLPGTRHC